MTQAKLPTLTIAVEFNDDVDKGCWGFQYLFEKRIRQIIESWLDNAGDHREIAEFGRIELREIETEQSKENSIHFEVLKDSDLMGFGKYKDSKIVDVPASYLIWLYDQPNTFKKYPKHFNYIKNNHSFLLKEAFVEEATRE